MHRIYKTLEGVWNTCPCNSSENIQNLEKDLIFLSENNPGVRYFILEDSYTLLTTQQIEELIDLS